MDSIKRTLKKGSKVTSAKGMPVEVGIPTGEVIKIKTSKSAKGRKLGALNHG